MRQMEQNPDVVVEYYRSRQHLITKFVENNLWEEDVNEWLNAIRKRSPSKFFRINLNFMLLYQLNTVYSSLSVQRRVCRFARSISLRRKTLKKTTLLSTKTQHW